MSKGKAFDVGIFGDKYSCYVNNVPLREYSLWYSLIRRCYSAVYQKDKPTYIGCEVSENFKSYTYFYEWCQDQIGFNSKDSDGKLWQLDKDILSQGKKTYSEDTCCFVPIDINAIFVGTSQNRKYDLPVGISISSTKTGYGAACSLGKKYKKHLGYFKTIEEAVNAYNAKKKEVIIATANTYQKDIDPRVYARLIEYAGSFG